MSTTIVIPCYKEARRLDLSQVSTYSKGNPDDRLQVKEHPLSTWHDMTASNIGFGAVVRAGYDLARIGRKET